MKPRKLKIIRLNKNNIAQIFGKLYITEYITLNL